MSLSISHIVSNHSHDVYMVDFFDDSIHTTVTSSPSVVDEWIDTIEFIHRWRLHKLIVGLDIEWRPNLSRNSENPVAVLQLCVGRRCLIFQLLYCEDDFPQSLYDFLDKSSYTFVGVGIEEDARKLDMNYGLAVCNTVDLSSLAYQLGHASRRQTGLTTLLNLFMDINYAKPANIARSRWDNEYLSHAQVQYACIDAFASFEIGRILGAADYK